jgi:hypothetical protein
MFQELLNATEEEIIHSNIGASYPFIPGDDLP